MVFDHYLVEEEAASGQNAGKRGDSGGRCTPFDGKYGLQEVGDCRP